MELVNVAPIGFRHLHPPQRRADMALDGILVAILGVEPLAADVLFQKPLNQIVDGRRTALGLDIRQRVAAVIDSALELAGFLARTGDGPIRKSADGIAALAASTVAIVENEGTMACSSDTRAKAGDRCVPGKLAFLASGGQKNIYG